MNKGDYSLRVWLLVGAVVVGVAVTEVFGLNVKSSALSEACEARFKEWYAVADSDISAAADDDELIEEYEANLIEEHEANFDELQQQLMAMERRESYPIHRWEITESKAPKMQRIKSQRLRLDDRESVIPIEIFESDTTKSFDRFIDKLIWGDEVRVAFLGDSFIEGDILTSDFRELMQETFGGRGVGFVQCDIPFGTVRRTIKRTASGWNAYSVLKPKSNPSSVNDEFFVSGYTARGKAGAKVTWQTTNAFERLDSCSRARIWLNTPDSARVKVKLNGDASAVREFALGRVDIPQEILIDGKVEKLELSVVSGTVDCYGASIEGVGGVIVDNLSMRANSGHAIFGTSAVVNRQIDEYAGYDLVVLQYGLNVMENNKHHYSSYRDKVQEMVAYAKSCFPDAAILVLGVSDRWMKNSETGVYGRMNSVGSMTSYQRTAAESTGAAFWSAAAAMEHYGGMATFVRNSWAAGDYTHINFAGGKRVGEQLYRSIVDYAYDRLVSGKSKMPTRRKDYYEPIKIEIRPFDNSVKMKTPVADSNSANAADTSHSEGELLAVDTEETSTEEQTIDTTSSEIEGEVDAEQTDAEQTDAEQEDDAHSDIVVVPVDDVNVTVEWDNYQMGDEEEATMTTSPTTEDAGTQDNGTVEQAPKSEVKDEISEAEEEFFDIIE